METSWNSLGEMFNGEKYASFSSDERTYIAMVYRLKKARPDEVIIKAEPKNNDGCIYAWFPSKYLRIVPTRKMNLTEEQKLERAEKMRAINAKKNGEFPLIKDERLPFTDLDEDLAMEMAEREFEM